MAVRNRQIGWSNKSNLLYDVLREFNAIKGQFAVPATTTTTTTAAPVNSTLSVDINGFEGFFDIPFAAFSFGCWLKMDNDTNFPRIFSIGQYPSAAQAISIESDTLFFWYNGSIEMSYPLTSYIGNWMWICITGSTIGNVGLWIDGVNVANVSIGLSAALTSPMYIGSENVPNTYLNGNIAGFIFDQVGFMDLRFPPTSPLVPGAGTVLLIGQGSDLTTQLTNQGLIPVGITNSNCTYSTDSPYSPAVGGSIKFGV